MGGALGELCGWTLLRFPNPNKPIHTTFANNVKSSLGSGSDHSFSSNSSSNPSSSFNSSSNLNSNSSSNLNSNSTFDSRERFCLRYQNENNNAEISYASRHSNESSINASFSTCGSTGIISVNGIDVSTGSDISNICRSMSGFVDQKDVNMDDWPDCYKVRYHTNISFVPYKPMVASVPNRTIPYYPILSHTNL